MQQIGTFKVKSLKDLELHTFDFRFDFISGKSVIYFKDRFFCLPSYKLYARLNPERRWTHLFKKIAQKGKKKEKIRKIVFLSFEKLFHYTKVLRDRQSSLQMCLHDSQSRILHSHLQSNTVAEEKAQKKVCYKSLVLRCNR